MPSFARSHTVRSRTVTGTATLTPADDLLLADATGQAPPTNLVATPGPGGSFAAATYAWVVTAVGPSGESIIQVPVGKAVTLNQEVVLTWAAAPGATSYRVYRTPFDFGDATNVVWALVAAVGNVTTYTDEGAATSAGTPPATNGAAFTITLPSAVGYTEQVTVKAVGATKNLVTLDPDGAQTIDGAPTLTIGKAAPHEAVTLASDGTNWRVVASVANTPKVVQRMNPDGVACGGTNVGDALVVVPVPALVRGVTMMAMKCSLSVTPGVGTTALMASINECDVNGVAANPANNLAFWYFKNFTEAEEMVFAASWSYDPRPGDTNLEGGTGKYLGLHLLSTGANSTGFNGALQLTAGALDSNYWPDAI